MFEPDIAGEQIDSAISIHVNSGHSFRIAKRCLAGRPRIARKDFGYLPGRSLMRIAGNFRQKNLLGPLIPKSELRTTSAEEIAENLVVMLRCAASLDDVAFPRDFWIEIRIWILPPPDLMTLPISAKNDVEIAVTVDIVDGASRLDCQEI